ncbi:MAG: transcriptional regulator [Rhodobacteraceae bacterium]|nr:transcriptional regulator [Paracoccaceae bacterium]
MPPKHITAHQLREVLGGISDMTLWRWINDPAKRFPQPIKIGACRLWKADEVTAYLENQALKAS